MQFLSAKLTLQEQQMARESLPALSDLANTSDATQVRIDLPTGRVAIPRKAFDLIAFIVSEMAEGRLVELHSSDTELTTQQAASILNVSRPHLVKLLEQGEIAFKKVGSHRRVFLTDLLRYKEQQQVTRRETLQFLAEQAQKLNLGYE